MFHVVHSGVIFHSVSISIKISVKVKSSIDKVMLNWKYKELPNAVESKKNFVKNVGLRLALILHILSQIGLKGREN